MATSLERMEDDVKEMVENLVDEALAKPLDGLEERIEKVEQFIANLGPLARLSERLAEAERLLTLYGLDIEKNEANVEALLEEHKLQGTINASLQGQVNSINERIEGEAATIAEHHLSLSVLERNLSVIERNIQTIFNNLTALNELTAPAETAALALYGGEQ